MKIKKGDKVKVISGKDKGRISNVLAVLRDEGRVIVEKVNVCKKHKKQTDSQKDPGGIVEVERPIDISNVQVVCPACDKPTRLGFKFVEDRKRRYCKKCNEILDE